MTYKETLDFLYKKLPMFQRVGKSAYKKDLTNTLQLLEALDNPHEKFKSVHVAGTNGKGTSAHGIAAILQLAGYKTGLYTSPHLKNFTERIKIDGCEIDQTFVINFVSQIRPHIERIQPSFFEITVAMAFRYFSDEAVDIAVIETGLGGRLDSTNVLLPEVCLITNIGLDHTDMLGETLEEIASEKAGIIKAGVPVVLGSYQEDVIHVFRKKALDQGADLIVPDIATGYSVWPPNFPYYKVLNQMGISNVIDQLRKKGWRISQENEDKGFFNLEKITQLKGRFQLLQGAPKVIADVSHNQEGLKVLFDQIASIEKEKLFIVFGTVIDKELAPIFSLIPREAKLLWTQSDVPRSLPVADLKDQAKLHGLEGNSYEDVNEALNAALSNAKKNDLILVTGSTFVVAEIKNL